LHKVGCVVGFQHEVGWYQKDDHLGNYLWGHDKLWMLDAGSFAFVSSPLSLKDRLANMALLAANIPLSLMSEFNRAMGLAYKVSLPGFNEAYRQAVCSRLRKYYKKTRRSCTEFECKKDEGWKMLSCRDMDASLKLKMFSDPDQFFIEERLIKNGNTCSVVEICEGGRRYILKRYNQKSLLYRLSHALITPRALSSWSNGHVLRLFGVPTPRPVACLLLKSAGMLKLGYLLMEKVDAITLADVDTEKLSEASQKIPSGFAKIWSELEVLNATHGDMKATNFMVDTEDEVSLIDLDSLLFHQSKKKMQRRQQKDLKRFMKNWEGNPVVQAAFQNALSMRR